VRHYACTAGAWIEMQKNCVHPPHWRGRAPRGRVD